MTSNHTILIESDDDARLLHSLFPTLSPAIVTLGELLNWKPAEERFAAFEREFPDLDEARRTFNTIEALRESLILTDEHVSHCFSELPQTPKNTQLKSVLQRYLRSDLKQEDRTQKIWDFIGRVKTERPKLPLGRVSLTGQMPFLLHELATALAYAEGIETAEVVSPLELGERISNASPRVLSGKDSETLVALAREIGNSLGSGNVIVPFGGSDKARQFLKFYLHHLRIPFNDLFEKPGITERVVILPFQSLPSLSPWKILSYADNAVFEPPVDNLLFSFSEIEALHRAGFSLPRYISYRERTLRTLRHYAGVETLYTILDAEKLLEIPSQRVTAPIPAEPLPHRREATPVPLPKRSLSATQLETYAECPSKYFFANRMKLRRALESEEQYALIFGQSVHLTLERFLQQNHSIPENAEQILSELFHASVKECAGELPPSLITVLESHFEKISKRFLALETELTRLFGKHEPMALEAEFDFTMGGLQFRGKIDRIEKTENGVLVLDYKTGNVPFCPDHISQGHHFQALLYLLGLPEISKEAALGILFYDLKKGEVRRGLLIEDCVSAETKKAVTRGHTVKREKYEEITGEGISHLKTLAAEIARGNFEATPSAEACRFCEYTSFCRQGHGYV